MKLGQNELLILTILAKFHNDWVKIVDFLLKAYFSCALFFASHLMKGLLSYLILDLIQKSFQMYLNYSHLDHQKLEQKIGVVQLL